MTIDEITNLTEEEVKNIALEHLVIKEHDCYTCMFGEYFGYSITVFKNGKHIFYANDYQLHHPNKNILTLKAIYIKQMNQILFTDAELLGTCKNYIEYKNKERFLRSYWIMQYDRLSIFGIRGMDEKEFKEEKHKYPYFNKFCFCYVKDKCIVRNTKKYAMHLKKELKKLLQDDCSFREAIRYELANYEACITGDYRDALDALGLDFEMLSDMKQNIIKQELNKQIQMYG